MAKENVKKFYEEFTANKELQEKFIEVQKGYEAKEKREEEILEDIVLPIAKEAGYEFTMDEYRAVQRDAMVEKGISEEELENVSGGGGCCVIIGFCNEISAREEELYHACAYVGFGLDWW